MPYDFYQYFLFGQVVRDGTTGPETTQTVTVITVNGTTAAVLPTIATEIDPTRMTMKLSEKTVIQNPTTIPILLVVTTRVNIVTVRTMTVPVHQINVLI